MKLIQITAPDPAAASVLAAIAAIVPAENVRVYSEVPPAPPAPPPGPDSKLVAAIADAVRPGPSHAMRRKALEAALGGYDSYWAGHGEADPAMRNALGWVSKALKAVFPNDASPISRLAQRRKHYAAKAMGGGYLGVRYETTALGVAVRDRLTAEGAIFPKAKPAVT